MSIVRKITKGIFIQVFNETGQLTEKCFIANDPEESTFEFDDLETGIDNAKTQEEKQVLIKRLEELKKRAKDF